MSSRALCMAFLMDPIESLDIQGDTTFVLMLEAQNRGHRVLYLQPHDLRARGDQVVANVHPVELRREHGRHVDVGEPYRVVLDDEVDVLFQRKDPPVDPEYVFITQLLSLCRRTLVLNRPESILAANEKLFALHYAQYMPETMVTREIAELLEFMEEIGGDMIVKPLDGKGGEGVFHVHAEDRNLSSILELSTDFGTRLIMAQRYLPEIRQGDKRILLLDGDPLGAVLRVPARCETRANLHVGGRPEKTKLDENDRKIIESLAPGLRELGLFFVGIDVIGGFLTEINVTSPTGIQEINTLEGVCLEKAVIERIETMIKT